MVTCDGRHTLRKSVMEITQVTSVTVCSTSQCATNHNPALSVTEITQVIRVTCCDISQCAFGHSVIFRTV